MFEPGYNLQRALICVADDMETELKVQTLDSPVLMDLLGTDKKMQVSFHLCK